MKTLLTILLSSSLAFGVVASTKTINVKAKGISDASKGNYKFVFTNAPTGAYTYIIKNFSKGDIIDLPTPEIGSYSNFSNVDLVDGKVQVGWHNGSNGTQTKIVLYGLTVEQDIGMQGTTDLNAVFGAGTLR